MTAPFGLRYCDAMTELSATQTQPTEFVFGPLSTVEGRVQRARSFSVGLQLIPSLEPLDPLPGEAVTVSVRAGLGVAIEQATLYFTLDGSLPVVGGPGTHPLPLQLTRRDWDTLTWSYVETWCATIPGQPEHTRVRYLITAQSATGELVPCPYLNLTAPEVAAMPNAFDRRYFHRLLRQPAPQVFEYHVDRFTSPEWFREAVIYQIFVDRFAPDPGASLADTTDLSAIFGGTLRGITARLDYLCDLGVNCLWLTPIFPAPSHHGYDPTDYFTIEPRLGSLAGFQELVATAHRRGIRIVLDFVANHISRQHPTFLAAQADAASPACDWFFFREHPHSYEAFYDVPDQPIVKHGSPCGARVSD
ncbi:MAG: hypothetical protein IPK16_17580 [Anaerolineales bacterium]|nr:hypothetical protein [Anaerolineales bacterium]